MHPAKVFGKGGLGEGVWKFGSISGVIGPHTCLKLVT